MSTIFLVSHFVVCNKDLKNRHTFFFFFYPVNSVLGILCWGNDQRCARKYTCKDVLTAALCNVLEAAGMLTSGKVVPSPNEIVHSHQYDSLEHRHREWGILLLLLVANIYRSLTVCQGLLNLFTRILSSLQHSGRVLYLVQQYLILCE